jgi:DNA-binding NarL/FixJ family response regulator
MLRILIADDHEIVRRGVRQIIESHPDWEVCGEAGNGEAALEIAAQEQPDIAIVDVGLPLLGGIMVTRRLRLDSPSTRVLLFTMHDDEESVNGGLAAGARGYLLKTDSGLHLEAAISALEARQPYFSSMIAEMLLEAAVSDKKPWRLGKFTGRELQVGQLVAEGRSNKEIAMRLGIAVKTVESNRASAMRKAGVRTAREFVRFAIKNNLIRP